MKLIIAEKPGVAAEIAKALRVSGRKNGYIENDEWTITWCVGHLCTLKEPHEYDEKYKEWSLVDLPIIPKKYELKPIENTKDQYEIVSELLNEDFEFVVNATDAGREGELIFDNVYRLSGSKIPIKRLWTSAALTEEAIMTEFKNLRPGSDFDGLRMAARVRAACDWVIGMNATRAVTLNVGIRGQVFSIGRVQTPTLSFLVKRELEIQKFKSSDFYSIRAQFQTNGTTYFGTYKYQCGDGNLSSRIAEKSRAEDLLSKIESVKSGVVDTVEKQIKKDCPPSLFDLTGLQKEANKIFGFSAEETSKIAQSLYEQHKVLSYPRTDYKCLPNEMREEIPKILNTLKNLDYSEKWFELAMETLDDNECKHIFDNSKVGDHHALIPMARVPGNLSDKEKMLYDMILKRLLASLNEDHIYEDTKVITKIASEGFHAKGISVLKNGWKDIYSFKEEPEEAEGGPKENEEQKLPQLNKGQTVSVASVKMKADKTKPPKRLSEADLLNCMQKPHLYIQKEGVDEDLIDSLKTKGIGTPATRANVIKNLIDKNYLERAGKTLKPTEKGVILIKNLEPESLKSPIMTSEWESKLVMIEEGKMKPIEFANEMNLFVEEIVEKAKGLGAKFKGTVLADSAGLPKKAGAKKFAKSKSKVKLRPIGT